MTTLNELAQLPADIKRRVLVPGELFDKAPFSCSIVTVPPGQSTRYHSHHEVEVWIVLEGVGEVSQLNRSIELAKGTVVLLDALTGHALVNTGANALSVLAFWWDGGEPVVKECAQSVGGQLNILLPAFPTPNGDLHLGHLSGPYLAFDIIQRAIELSGGRVKSLIGTLGHMNHVGVVAERLGLSYYQAAEAFSDKIAATLDALQIHSDIFVRPTPSADYTSLTERIFLDLLEKNVIRRKAGTANFCPTCDQFVFEADVAGSCPTCNAPASGNDCESCGKYHDDGALLSPTCRRCGGATEARQIDRFYLALEALRSDLEYFHDRVAMNPQLRQWVDDVMSDPLPEVAATCIGGTGIAVPVTTHADQRIFSCIEHAGRFYIALDALARKSGLASDWQALLAAEDLNLTVLFGFDNAFMRAFLFPALLIGFRGRQDLPRALVMNQFFLLEGAKFSTSRNHVIWGREFVEEYPVDAVRFYLSLIRPEAAQADFKAAAFRAFLETTVDGKLRRWAHRVATRAEQHNAGCVPDAGGWDGPSLSFHAKVRALCDRVKIAYAPASFSAVDAAAALLNFLDDALLFEDETKPLRGQALSRHERTHLALLAMALRTWAILVKPIAPGWSREMLQAFSPDLCDDRFDALMKWVPAGSRLDAAQIDRGQISNVASKSGGAK